MVIENKYQKEKLKEILLEVEEQKKQEKIQKINEKINNNNNDNKTNNNNGNNISNKMKKRKVLLIIRDGWGYRFPKYKNATKEVVIPFTEKLMLEYPNVLIKASQEAVGLPKGYQGNSEVGHMTIGAGRIQDESLIKINNSINNGEFYHIKEFLDAIENCKVFETNLHLIGLIQTQGVHSHLDHLYALLRLARDKNVKVHVHAITDGRDAPVKESINHIIKLNKFLKDNDLGDISSICGRFYAMDRDNRWDRIKDAYEGIVNANSIYKYDDPINSINSSYEKNVTDEFIIPRVNNDYKGFKKNDSVIFFNYRTDRTRELTKAIVEKKFDGFKREKKLIFFVAMTQYYNPMDAHVAFKEEFPKNILGEVVSLNKLKQLRISETEKYAHVTFFFNSQIEKPFLNEDRILINSPKVRTYDLKPEMSVFEIKDKLIEQLDKNNYDLIVSNFVNGDMVGHTGNRPAIKMALKAVDKALEEVVIKALEKDYTILVFADHGNAEDQRDKWLTSHTINPVPFILVTNEEELKNVKLNKNMGLANIAPTTLKLLGLEIPDEMTKETIIDFSNL